MKTSLHLRNAGSAILRQPKQKNSNVLQTTRTEKSLDLSKLRYKNGNILKDAANSSPGYGLWCVQLTEKNDNNTHGMKNDIKDLLAQYNLPYGDDIVEKMDKILIQRLKERCEDLEKKLANSLSAYYEKENICLNAEKMKQEFEDMLDETTKEKNDLLKEKEFLDNHVANLTAALNNAQKEIKRLSEIIKNNQKIIDKVSENYEEKIKEEKKVQEDLKRNVILLEHKVESLSPKEEEKKENPLKKLMNPSFVQRVFKNNDNTNKLEYKIKTMSDIILDLQIQISNLKKKVLTLENEKSTLHDIIKFKEKKNNYQKDNINNLFEIVEEKKRKDLWNKEIIKQKNNTIKTLVEQNNDLKKANSKACVYK